MQKSLDYFRFTSNLKLFILNTKYEYLILNKALMVCGIHTVLCKKLL